MLRSGKEITQVAAEDKSVTLQTASFTVIEIGYNKIQNSTNLHSLAFQRYDYKYLDLSVRGVLRSADICSPLRSVILCGFCKHRDSLTAVNMQITVSSLKWYLQLPPNIGNFYQIMRRRQKTAIFKTLISVRIYFMTVSNEGLTALTFYSLLLAWCTIRFNIQQLYALPTLYLCVLYLSENKQRLVPLTA